METKSVAKATISAQKNKDYVETFLLLAGFAVVVLFDLNSQNKLV